MHGVLYWHRAPTCWRTRTRTTPCTGRRCRPKQHLPVDGSPILAQGSYLLAHPDAYDSMYWKALPAGTFWPGFAIATLAAIIASQALISAVFQIVSQAIVAGFFPRFHVYHTSREVRLLSLACASLHCTVAAWCEDRMLAPAGRMSEALVLLSKDLHLLLCVHIAASTSTLWEEPVCCPLVRHKRGFRQSSMSWKRLCKGLISVLWDGDIF